MLPDTVTEIIDEVAPLDERGKPRGKRIEFAGCNALSIDQYESVTITRYTHECLPLQPAREHPATLTFNKTECAAIEKADSNPETFLPRDRNPFVGDFDNVQILRGALTNITRDNARLPCMMEKVKDDSNRGLL